MKSLMAWTLSVRAFGTYTVSPMVYAHVVFPGPSSAKPPHLTFAASAAATTFSASGLRRINSAASRNEPAKAVSSAGVSCASSDVGPSAALSTAAWWSSVSWATVRLARRVAISSRLN